jgi:hypothetical protein
LLTREVASTSSEATAMRKGSALLSGEGIKSRANAAKTRFTLRVFFILTSYVHKGNPKRNT